MLKEKKTLESQDKSKRYNNSKKVIAGKVIINKKNLIISNQKEKRKIILSKKDIGLIFNGDIISLKILAVDKRGNLKTSIKNIIKRNTKKILGKYKYESGIHLIRPSSNKISTNITILPPKEVIKENTLIEVEIVDYPSKSNNTVAKISKIFKDTSNIFRAISTASQKYNIKSGFSREEKVQAKKLPNSISKKEISDRKDLRKLAFITIDTEDAKDFDDAVYACKKYDGDWKLYIAIADVSYYVRPSSLLDSEAKKRFASVYFPNHTIPMLPEKISNELCSLNPNLERLTLVCEIDLKEDTEIKNYRFYSAVIKSRQKFSYKEASTIIDNGFLNEVNNKKEIYDNLFHLNKLCKKLKKKRKERGSIDFNFEERKILVDKQYEVLKIVKEKRNTAQSIIEECMIITNHIAAKFLGKNGKIIPYRTHEQPKLSKIQNFRNYLKNLRMDFPVKEPLTPKKCAIFFKRLEEKSNSREIKLNFLRNMNQAKYTVDNCGHFGLAYNKYTHFTSPIRRYIDLLIHRIIKSKINEKELGGKYYSSKEINKICSDSTEKEKKIEKASRYVEKWLECKFIKKHISKKFDARITHIAHFGFFSEIEEYKIEGFVNIKCISNDQYTFDKNKNILTGKNCKKQFNIGQKIKIFIKNVNLDKQRIEFKLLD